MYLGQSGGVAQVRGGGAVVHLLLLLLLLDGGTCGTSRCTLLSSLETRPSCASGSNMHVKVAHFLSLNHHVNVTVSSQPHDCAGESKHRCCLSFENEREEIGGKSETARAANVYQH